MKRKMSKDEALKKLIKTRELSTGMLQPLGIPFEFFLRYSQLSMNRNQNDQFIDKLIERLSK